MNTIPCYCLVLSLLTLPASYNLGTDLGGGSLAKEDPVYQPLLAPAAATERPQGRLLFTTTGKLEILDSVTGVRTQVPLPPGMFPSLGIASWCGGCEWIVFAGGAGLNSQIWIVRPDGSGLRRITDGHGDLVEPDPRPDCSVIAFHPVYGNGHLINIDGTSLTNLGVVLAHGRFSPDGRYIAGTDWATPTYNSSVYIYDLFTGTLAKILSPTGDNAFPRVDWFPDGTKLVVEHIDRSRSPLNNEIWTCNVDGSDPRNLTADWPASSEGSPTVTPDGQFILFSSNREGSFDIWSMRPDGTARVNLTATPSIDEGTPASFCPAAPADSDGDGVPDTHDLCPETLPGAIVDGTGCSIDQLVPCEGPVTGEPWKNHGGFVAAVVRVVEEFVAAGLLTPEQAGAVVSAAAQSDCGKSR